MNSLVVVVFLSKAALRSDWVIFEIMHGREKCLPVMLEKINQSLWPEELRGKLYAELLEPYIGAGRKTEDYERCVAALYSAILSAFN
jgi:hypothetical protein